MRRTLILTVVATLLCAACGGEPAADTPKPSPSLERTLGESAPLAVRTAGKGSMDESTLDPAFAAHRYPNSKATQVVTIGNVVSVFYDSADTVATVAAHYTSKGYKGAAAGGGAAYFSAEAAGAAGFTITVTTRDGAGAQIILRLEKPQ